MAKKKYKKRTHSSTVEAKRLAEQERLAGEKSQAKKRWDPAGRALLYIDLIFLAVAAILDTNELVSDVVSGMCTIIGIILLVIALWLLFRKKNDGVGKRSGW